MHRLRRWLKWLTPGLGIKRWILVLTGGILCISAGVAAVVPALRVFGGNVGLPLGGTLILAVGIGATVLGVRGIVRAIAGAFLPRGDPRLVEIISRERRLRRGPRVVALGGGTGLSTVLRGMKRYTSNITAVVTVFDDGGSSGRLRRELKILPPGDIRDCLVALAEVEPLMTKLFEYRFSGGTLDGHAFGNLFIASMVGVTGDLEVAIKECSKVLNIRGRVLPTTTRDVVLRAEFADGTVVEGESNITGTRKPIRRIFLWPEDVPPLPEVLEAIAEADLIVLGPGSLFTSIIPNLLVRDLAESIRAAPGVKVYVCNLMTQPGETDGFTASDHVRAILDHAGGGLFTHVLVNGCPPSDRALLLRYQQEGAIPVTPDVGAIRELGFVPTVEDLLSEGAVLRHDPRRLARTLMRFLAQHPKSGRRFSFSSHLMNPTNPVNPVSLTRRGGNNKMIKVIPKDSYDEVWG